MHLVLASRLNAVIYGYWVKACDGRAMPNRAAIDPAKIKAQIPYVYIADVMRDEGGMWFRFRLMGTKLAQNLKQDGTNRSLIDLSLGGWEVEWGKNLVYATQMKMPIADEATIRTPNGLMLDIEHLALPLSEDGVTVDRIFGAIDFYNLTEDQLTKALPKLDWASISSVELAKRIVISNLRIGLDDPDAPSDRAGGHGL